MASLARIRRASSARAALLSPIAAAALLALAGPARAQETQTVQVTGHGAETAGVGGFAQPLARTPLQADVIDTKTLADIGATSLSDITRLDASLVE